LKIDLHKAWIKAGLNLDLLKSAATFV